MTAHTRLDPPLVESIRKALTGNALPGETQGLTPRGRARSRRIPRRRSPPAASAAKLAIAIESTGGEAGNRRMRIGIVNDDMPFLVDSVANAIAAPPADHPPPASPGRLRGPRRQGRRCTTVEPLCADKSRRESMMYLELDRADARGRQELAADLKRVLDDVRLAVRDWPKLQGKMREDAAAIDDPEGAALLDWFADGAMTLLGYHVEKPYEAAVRARSASSAFPALRPTRAAASARCAISSRAATCR